MGEIKVTPLPTGGGADVDETARSADSQEESPRQMGRGRVAAAAHGLGARARKLLDVALMRNQEDEEEDEEEGALKKGRARDTKAVKGILKTGNDHGRRRAGDRTVKWRMVLAGEEATLDDERARQQIETDEREKRERFKAIARLARIPIFTLEELMIPLRLAFPHELAYSGVAIVIDAIGDLFELCWIAKTIMEQPTGEERRKLIAEARASATTDDGSAVAGLYLTKHAVRDIGTSLALHIARAIYILTGNDWMWSLVQIVRAVRVRELVMYVQEINTDLTVNVKFLAAYKFSIVILSVPHWVACCWWALGGRWSNQPLELPNWPAQIPLLTENADLDPAVASLYQQYLMSLYMAWMGLTSMGYGTIILTEKAEVLFAALVAAIQMVFYAFVLGTLFQYLVRTDQSTVHYNELMKAVDDYVAERKLPKELALRIRGHYQFQHRKLAAGSDLINSQMPLSLRVEVASSQHMRQMEQTWVFWSCNHQFLTYVTLYLRERYMMPSQVAFKRGDGAAELLWCVGGTMHMWRGDTLVSTVRSELGPGQVVGEVAFFIGLPHPYTALASSKGEVTLSVLTATTFLDVIASYPEQTDLILQNVLRKYGLDKEGADLANVGFAEQMDEDEKREYEALRTLIRTAILDRNEELFSQMAIAVRHGDVETVRQLIARGFNIQAVSHDKRTPLHLACVEGHSTVVKLLCDLGADTAVKDRFGASPFENAMKGKHSAVADELVKAGAQLVLDLPHVWTHSAAKHGDMPLMTMLVAHGVPLDSRNYDGRTALHVAATEGNLRVTEYLISNMCDVHTRDRHGRSALDDAILLNHQLVAQMLVKASARAEGEHIANMVRQAATRGDVERLRFLFTVGAKVNLPDYDGRTPLHFAVMSGSISSVYLLVKAMADVNCEDRWSRPPLMDAFNVDLKIASILISAGATVPAQFAMDEQIQRKMDKAKTLNLYEVTRAVTKLAHLHDHHATELVDKSREVEMSIMELASDLSKLHRHQRTTFRTVGKWSDFWINEYGEELDSDTDSDPDSDDGKGKDDDSDSDDDGRGARAAGGAALGQDGSFEQQDSRAASKQFIKLVLQLPSAEAGLIDIRDRFAAVLSSERFSQLEEKERRKAEDKELLLMLQHVFDLDADRSIEVLRDVYDELKSILGDAAPISPAEAGKLGTAKPVRAAAAASAESEAADELEAMARQYAAGGNNSSLHGRRSSSADAKAVTAAVQRHDSKGKDGSFCKSNGSFKETLRRGSKTGAGLIEMSRQLNDAKANAERAGAQRGAQLADEESDGPLFLSELGHVVLFCSRRFIDLLAQRYGTRRRKKAKAKGEAAALGASADPSEPAGARAARASKDKDLAAEDDDVYGSPKRKGRFSGMAARLRTSFNAEERQSTGDAAAGGDGSGSPRESDPGADGVESCIVAIEEACFLITRLFRVFDASHTGQIRMRDVRRLQSELGEFGSEEIKSLLTYLMAASRNLTAPPEEVAAVAEDGQLAADAEPVGTAAGRRRSTSRVLEDGGASGAGSRRTTLQVGLKAEGNAVDEELEKLFAAVAADADDGSADRRSSDDRNAAEAAENNAAADATDAAAAAATGDGTTDAAADPLRVNVAPAPPQANFAEVGAEESAPAEAAGGAAEAASSAAGVSTAVVASTAGEAEKAPPAEAPSSTVAPSAVGGRMVHAGNDQVLQLRSKGRSNRPAQSMSESQFFIGVSSWILLAVSEDAAAGAGADGNGVFIPKLRKGDVLAAGKVMSKAAQAKSKVAKAEAARIAAADESIVAELNAALGTATACMLLADNLTLRIETGRIEPAEEVDANVLLKAVQHALAIPMETTAEHIRGWVERELELTIPVRGRPVADARAAEEGAAAADGAVAKHHDGEEEDDPNHALVHNLLLSAAELEAEELEQRKVTWEKLVTKLRDRVAALRAAGGVDPLTGAASGGKKKGIVALLDKFDIQVGSREMVSAEAGVENGASTTTVWPWYIVSVHSRMNKLSVWLFYITVLWDVLTVPMQLCFFEQVVLMRWVPYVNLVCDALYMLRILLRFNTTFINDKSVEVFAPSEVRAHYLSNDFGLDAFACWPHDQVLWVLGIDPMIRFGVRHLRMINARYLLGAFKVWRSNLSERQMGRMLLKNALPLILIIHYCAGVWNVIGFSQMALNKWDNTWATYYLRQRVMVGGEDGLLTHMSPEEQLVDHYITAVFFVLSLVSALGVVQLPATYVEFAMFVSFCVINMTIYAYCVGGISGIVMKMDDEIVGKRAHLELVNAYVRHVNVPADLKERMTKFFVDKMQHASFSNIDSEQIYSGLPVPLQMEISSNTNRALMADTTLLKGCDEGFIDRLSAVLTEREIEAEMVIYRAGDQCKELILLASGTVEFSDGDENEQSDDKTQTAGPGEFLGEVAFIFGIRHHKTAKVSRNDKATTFVLNQELYRELLKSFPTQEDVLMDNAVRQYEGLTMGSARSGRSKASASSGARSSHSSGSGGGSSALGSSNDSSSQDGRSETGSSGGASDIISLQQTLANAKAKRDEMMHAKICVACVKGEFEKVRRLLSARSMDVDHADSHGRRPLQLAACGGHKKLIELLLAARADVNAEDKIGHTALDDALQSDNFETAALLASHGGLHGTRNVSEEMCAAGAVPGGTAVLQRFCSFGGNVNAGTLELRSATHVAAAEGRTENLLLLIENNSDVNNRDLRGATALQDALLGHQDEACALLVKHGAKLGEFDIARYVNEAATQPDVENLKRIITFACSVNQQDELGRAPLHLAASSRNVNGLNFLVGLPDIEIHLEDAFGNTAYDDALRDGTDEGKVVLAILLSRGGRPGSHLPRPTKFRTDVEAARIKVMRAGIDQREQMLRDVVAMRAWVKEEKEALKAFKEQLEKAAQLQRNRGAVLADEMPELWEVIYTYAEGYFDWREDATGTLAPLIDRWSDDAKEFALFATKKLKSKYDDVMALGDTDAKPVERLYEVTFRKPVKADAS